LQASKLECNAQTTLQFQISIQTEIKTNTKPVLTR